MVRSGAVGRDRIRSSGRTGRGEVMDCRCGRFCALSPLGQLRGTAEVAENGGGDGGRCCSGSGSGVAERHERLRGRWPYSALAEVVQHGWRGR